MRDDSDDEAGFCLPAAFSTSSTQMESSIPHGTAHPETASIQLNTVNSVQLGGGGVSDIGGACTNYGYTQCRDSADRARYCVPKGNK